MATSLLKVSVSDVFSKFESNKDYVRLIDCELGTIQFSVFGSKYRTDIRCFRYLIVGIRYFSVFRIPTSVSENIGYRFGISVYRPATTQGPRLSPIVTQKKTRCIRCGVSSDRAQYIATRCQCKQVVFAEFEVTTDDRRSLIVRKMIYCDYND